MEIIKVKTTSHEEWLELRSHYIGGSDAAAVVGLNSFQSPYSLWAEKTGRTPPFAGNLATEVGTYMEDFVAKKFAEVTGKKVRNCNLSFFNSDYPWAIANIDREIVGEDAGLEIKTTSVLNLKRFKNGEYPANYYVQCVHYMAVTGKKKWYLAVLIGNSDFRWFEIERDEDEINALMEAEKDLWWCIENDEAPAADGLPVTTDTLTEIYPDSDDEINIDLYPYEAIVKAYMETGDKMTELGKVREGYANQIKAYMAEAGTGETTEYKVTWKRRNHKTFDSKRFTKDNPDLDLSDYYKETASRAFVVKKKKEV